MAVKVGALSTAAKSSGTENAKQAVSNGLTNAQQAVNNVVNATKPYTKKTFAQLPQSSLGTTTNTSSTTSTTNSLGNGNNSSSTSSSSSINSNSAKYNIPGGKQLYNQDVRREQAIQSIPQANEEPESQTSNALNNITSALSNQVDDTANDVRTHEEQEAYEKQKRTEDKRLTQQENAVTAAQASGYPVDTINSVFGTDFTQEQLDEKVKQRNRLEENTSTENTSTGTTPTLGGEEEQEEPSAESQTDIDNELVSESAPASLEEQEAQEEWQNEEITTDEFLDINGYTDISQVPDEVKATMTLSQQSKLNGDVDAQDALTEFLAGDYLSDTEKEAGAEVYEMSQDFGSYLEFQLSGTYDDWKNFIAAYPGGFFPFYDELNTLGDEYTDEEYDAAFDNLWNNNWMTTTLDDYLTASDLGNFTDASQLVGGSVEVAYQWAEYLSNEEFVEATDSYSVDEDGNLVLDKDNSILGKLDIDPETGEFTQDADIVQSILNENTSALMAELLTQVALESQNKAAAATEAGDTTRASAYANNVPHTQEQFDVLYQYLPELLGTAAFQNEDALENATYDIPTTEGDIESYALSDLPEVLNYALEEEGLKANVPEYEELTQPLNEYIGQTTAPTSAYYEDIMPDFTPAYYALLANSWPTSNEYELNPETMQTYDMARGYYNPMMQLSAASSEEE